MPATSISTVQLKGKIPRRTHKVQVAGVAMGGGLPVVVQSMTNTDTADVPSTVAQVVALAEAGSELVRITVNNEEAAAAVPKIHEALLARRCSVPLVGDFHFNGHELLSRYPACAEALAKFRINPGNVGFGQNKDARFSQIIDIACRFRKPVRIGVNWGSIDQQLLARLMDENSQKPEPQSAQAVMRHAMITSALDSAKRAEELGLARDAVVLSCKVSGVQDLIHIYRTLSKLSDYPLHLGLTEAGMGSRGITSSASALAVLLQEGIGDTIRVSLTPEPGGDRTQEVRVAQEILQALELRSFSPSITACPGCGRTTSSAFQELAKDVEDYVRERMPHWRRNYVGVENLKLAVMGCVVNGPGESKQADIGISLPGTDEGHKAPVYINGEKRLTLKGDQLAGDFRKLVEEYVEQHHERRS